MSMLTEQQVKPSLIYKLTIHALSHYDIEIYPSKIHITFTKENYKDMNKKRVCNMQQIILDREGRNEITYLYNNCPLATYPIPNDDGEYEKIFKTLYTNIQNIYKTNQKLTYLRRKKKEFKNDYNMTKFYTNQIKGLENEKRGYKRNIRHVVSPLF